MIFSSFLKGFHTFFRQTYCYAYTFPLQFLFIFENSTSGVVSYKLYNDWSTFTTVLGAPSFLSPQVKRSAIVSNKNGSYKLPHELPNDLRLSILGNLERSGKSQNFIEL